MTFRLSKKWCFGWLTGCTRTCPKSIACVAIERLAATTHHNSEAINFRIVVNFLPIIYQQSLLPSTAICLKVPTALSNRYDYSEYYSSMLLST